MVGARVQRLDEHPEQPKQDGHLDYQRPQAANGVYARFPIQAHGFLGNPLAVSPVPVLYFPHPGLQVGHCPHLPELLDRQGGA